jgi:hypothetical protein
MAVHVSTQSGAVGSGAGGMMGTHGFHRSGPGGGHSAGSTQQRPRMSRPQSRVSLPTSSEHDAPDGHSACSRHTTASTSHSPGCATPTPAARRRQSFQYVTPSHPHVGSWSDGHTVGNERHDPAGASHVGFSQNVPGRHSSFAQRRSVGGASARSSVARTTGSSLQAAMKTSNATANRLIDGPAR